MTPADIKPEYTMSGFLSLMKHLLSGEKDYLIFETVHQCKNSELYKIDPWSLVDEAQREAVRAIANRRLSGEEFHSLYNDIKVKRKNGEIRIMRVITQTMKYENSYAGLGTVMDITDIREIEDKLKVLAQAIEQTDDMVRITDKDGYITFVNDALAKHTGYSSHKLNR